MASVCWEAGTPEAPKMSPGPLTVLAVCSIVLAGSAGATTNVTSRAYFEPFGGDAVFDTDMSTGAPVASSQVYSDPSRNGSSSVVAGVGSAVGTLVASASVSSPNGEQLSGAASTTWADTFTISSPGLTGESGTYVFDVQLDVIRNTLVSSSDPQCLVSCAETNVVFSIKYNGTFFASGGLFDYAHDTEDQWDSVYGDPTTGVRSLSVPIVFGIPQDMVVEAGFGMVVSAYVASGAIGAAAAAAADQSFAVRWLGIARVLDANGNPVAYSLTSDSGTDWSQPVAMVPEPETLPLFAMGLVILAFAGRHRQRA